MRCLEPQLIVAEDGRLPEELHETGEIECVILVWFQKLRVNLRHELLEFVLS